MNQMELKVESAQSYCGAVSRYNPPLEIGCYSINSDGKFRDSNEEIKYLVMPHRLYNLHMNLNIGYSEYIHIHEDTEDRFASILRWILSHEEVIDQKFVDCNNSKSRLDFVCFRGLLTSVASTIYEKSEDWMIYVTKFKSVFYMAVIKTEHKEEVEEILGNKGIRMSTWGFKFEQYMTSDTMASKPNTSVPVNENEKYYSMVKAKLDNHRMLLSAEVDGVDPNHFNNMGHDPKSMLRYIELKTSRIITTERQERNFKRYKLLKWYLQSYFTGISRLICGHRDDDGVVRELINYNVRDMPHTADYMWSSICCVNFCSHFFNFVKTCGMKDDPRVTYKIYWKPDSNIICEEYPEYQLLPDWYIENVNVI